MKNLVSFAVSATLMSMSMHSAAELANSVNVDKFRNEVIKRAVPISINKHQVDKKSTPRFTEEKDLEDKPYVYIVQLQDDSVAMYDGNIQGLQATNPQARLLRHNKARFKGSKRNSKLISKFMNFLLKLMKPVRNFI